VKTQRKERTPAEDEVVDRRPRIGGVALWFAVLGGVVAWVVQLGVGWSVMELSCLGPTAGGMYQQAGDSLSARIAVYAATGVPWLVAVAALATCLVLTARMRRIGADLLAAERTRLLLVVGLFLDVMTVCIITGGAVGLAFVEAC